MIDDSPVVEQHDIFLLPISIDTVRSFLVQKSLRGTREGQAKAIRTSPHVERFQSNLFDWYCSTVTQSIRSILLLVFLARLESIQVRLTLRTHTHTTHAESIIEFDTYRKYV